MLQVKDPFLVWIQHHSYGGYTSIPVFEILIILMSSQRKSGVVEAETLRRQATIYLTFASCFFARDFYLLDIHH